MIDKIQAMQIALDYLDGDDEDKPTVEECLASDEYRMSLLPETFWGFDVRGHDIWSIS